MLTARGGCSVPKGTSWSLLTHLCDLCGAQASSLVSLARGSFCLCSPGAHGEDTVVGGSLAFENVIKCLCQVSVLLMKSASFANPDLKLLNSFAVTSRSQMKLT